MPQGFSLDGRVPAWHAARHDLWNRVPPRPLSAEEEREALARPPALYDHALSLLREAPGGIPSRRGFALPPLPSRPDKDTLSRQALTEAVREALTPLPGDSATVHRRLAGLRVPYRYTRMIRSAVAAQPLPLPDGEREAVRALARELTRSGTTVPAVTVGLYLLVRLGEPEDIPYLTTLATIRDLSGPAIEALGRLNRRAEALATLVVTTSDEELLPLVGALWSDDQEAVRARLVSFPAGPRYLSNSSARRIAEAARLAGLLDRHPGDTGLVARAARLLVRMGCGNEAPTELLAYEDGVAVYGRVVVRAGLLPPTLDHHATLLALALGLSSGVAALLPWPPGRRESLLASLGRLLAEPRWAEVVDAVRGGTDGGGADERLRAGWIRRTGRKPFGLPAVAGRLRIEVVAGDPSDREPVETRILADGLPLVPAFFSRGPAEGPQSLLEAGGLRAGPEPREVRLAEAYCTEGCCGALRVTIRRDGDEVVWDGWQRPPYAPRSRNAPEPAAYRFDAAAYDAEVARAEADGSWSWPARTVARLIREGLAERPEILGRWDARRGWISSGCEEPDTTVVTFWHAPGLAAADTLKGARQFRWVLPDDGGAPEAQAAAALRRLAAEDPKTYARVCGGSPERVGGRVPTQPDGGAAPSSGPGPPPLGALPGHIMR